MFKLFKKKLPVAGEALIRLWDKRGISVAMGLSSTGELLISPEAPGYLSQLVDDGLASESEQGIDIAWADLYTALERPEYAHLPDVLLLPRFTTASMALKSHRALTDSDFAIAVSGWRASDGTNFGGEAIGPILNWPSELEMMRPAQWAVLSEVISFARRSESERTDKAHRQAWGRIRKLALTANAHLDDFLARTVVLTPEKLNIRLRRSEHVADDSVIEVIPGVPDAPDEWIELFDRRKDIPDRYDIATGEGIVQILVTDRVRTVLQEVKRMDGRRVAGTRAQAFILNPYALLGPDANVVIDEDEFEKARDDADLRYERFAPVIERDASGAVEKVGLLIESASSHAVISSQTEWLDVDSLRAFVAKFSVAVRKEHLLVSWQGYELEVQGDAERILAELMSALAELEAPAVIISYESIHDLNGYSARVEGIGIEKPYYSPYIAKKDDSAGWFPENVLPMIVYDPKDGRDPIAVPTSRESIERLKKQIDAAQLAGIETVKADWSDSPMRIDEARGVVATFQTVFKDLDEGGGFNPDKKQSKGGNRELPKQLLLRSNIQKVEYEEMRRDALNSAPTNPTLPAAIRQGYSLQSHQLEGLAWLQHLYRLQNEYQVRGAILADDMGLGKTFQLLSLMAWLLETTPHIDPMLVVAPVALLENWADEAQKFFDEGTLPILTAYGSGLDPLRVPREQVDHRLKAEDRLVKFLTPGWIGSAKIVLTTYETLRDLEFSFAAQKWSLMVCDEAQKIKNPAAMVTRAAKKQNVAFKIACTGTPVENTLADLWCLFDFVQPGLLGALNEFGGRYRKPIEAKTAEEKARVEELRARISGQILRRMKRDVANLPEKVIVDECRRLQISPAQRNFYAKSVESFKKRLEPEAHTPFKNHLGLLQYLRLVCTDPRPHGLTVFKPEPTNEYRAKAPKLDWLLKTLHSIQGKGEKAIVFCEFREIQRLLQHYIEAELKLKPDIINGDTAAAASHMASRQKRIKAFQAKAGFGVIILSPVAVGFGVNIQEANHVIHYTRTWNPAKEDQATDRAYRIGQTRKVYVYYPVVTADDFTTFDAKLDVLLAYKRKLAEDMLNGSGDVSPADFDLLDVVPGDSAEDIDERVNLEMALRMDWQRFECLVGAIWAKRGFKCYRTPGAKDYGVDVVAFADHENFLLQAKSSGIDGFAFSWDAVKEVVAGEAFYKQRHAVPRFSKICITNQYFNRHAQENAALNNVELLDQRDLESLLTKHEVTMLDVERMLHTDWH